MSRRTFDGIVDRLYRQQGSLVKKERYPHDPVRQQRDVGLL